MGFRSVLVALLGIAIAGGSAYAAKTMIAADAPVAAADGRSDLVRVVIATRDIPYGQAIQAQMLEVISWPRGALPPNAINDIALLIPKTDQPPRRAKFGMAAGDLILASKVSEFGAKVTIVQGLGVNTRAMAIKVDAETAVAGFVTPGDTVDILLTQGKNEDLRSVTILQNIRVIGVDQDSDANVEQPTVARTVTVEVSPDNAQRLALAQEAGTLSLSLRTLDGATDAPMQSVRLSDLLHEKSPVPEAEVTKSTVRVRRATAVEIVDLN